MEAIKRANKVAILVKLKAGVGSFQEKGKNTPSSCSSPFFVLSPAHLTSSGICLRVIRIEVFHFNQPNRDCGIESIIQQQFYENYSLVFFANLKPFKKTHCDQGSRSHEPWAFSFRWQKAKLLKTETLHRFTRVSFNSPSDSLFQLPVCNFLFWVASQLLPRVATLSVGFSTTKSGLHACMHFCNIQSECRLSLIWPVIGHRLLLCAI